MRRLHVFLPALGLCLWTDVALANAGGYVFGVKFTGSLAPFQASGTECVRIVEENLDIDLRRTDASVVVRYTMRNFAESPMSVRFGFPVEANPRDESWEDEQYQRNARPKAFRSPIPQLKEYRVTANGNPVKAKFGIEPFATGKIKPFPGSAALKNIAGWMVSNVTFPAAASLTLEIRYAADYLGSSTFWATKTESTPLTFVYRLSTGAVWNGPIEKGTVTVRADGIPTAEVEIVAPRGRFRRDGDRWVWSFRDLEPTLADDIAMRLTRNEELLAEFDFTLAQLLPENGTLTLAA